MKGWERTNGSDGGCEGDGQRDLVLRRVVGAGDDHGPHRRRHAQPGCSPIPGLICVDQQMYIYKEACTKS